MSWAPLQIFPVLILKYQDDCECFVNKYNTGYWKCHSGHWDQKIQKHIQVLRNHRNLYSACKIHLGTQLEKWTTKKRIKAFIYSISPQIPQIGLPLYLGKSRTYLSPKLCIYVIGCQLCHWPQLRNRTQVTSCHHQTNDSVSEKHRNMKAVNTASSHGYLRKTSRLGCSVGISSCGNGESKEQKQLGGRAQGRTELLVVLDEMRFIL